MNPGCRVQDQFNTSELTAPYIIGRELNIRKLPSRQISEICLAFINLSRNYIAMPPTIQCACYSAVYLLSHSH